MPDRESRKEKYFKRQHIFWKHLCSPRSFGHFCVVVPKMKYVVSSSFLFMECRTNLFAEQLNIFCHSAPNSMLSCPEVPQNSLTFLSGISCCHLLCWPFLTLLFLCKLLVHLCLRTPVELIAHYSAKHSGETQDRGEVACNQFFFSKPQIKNRNASPDKRY